MDYYRKKAQVEALLLEMNPPPTVRQYFRVVKEVYAHERYELTLSLCEAFVLSVLPRGQGQGSLMRSESVDNARAATSFAEKEMATLEAICAAVALALVFGVSFCSTSVRGWKGSMY
ncbi:hypothetical protein DPQ33_10000 [Oceanidesulfovibrio indonesiensis]|uniref:Uncharacterized protein n=1 Tax=Oceanidesulfovibrio indonesiensis TaxID=54767 RepID=A0A7M3ME74_9BACT|nr:hypothetical protein [Oceanidesulfovibrio indonesiensis]TVM17120.1 hypothetical protein DPQ33_10000 [Oceanidesulfovibrio indonesiensis]